ncbi:rCG32225 [Rattus norvegicus]|uniref:RCG32225 n=1 Tax=Rattus norvegicus TaxID=10116 RepID=A6JXR4_RAT|nr:rCG32225 [Rattus norvegicus]
MKIMWYLILMQGQVSLHSGTTAWDLTLAWRVNLGSGVMDGTLGFIPGTPAPLRDRGG